MSMMPEPPAADLRPSLVTPLPDEVALVRAAQRGDLTARTQLFAYYYPLLLEYASALARQMEPATEVAHDTVVAALAQMYQLRDPTMFWPWLRGIARHRWADQRRRVRWWRFRACTLDEVLRGRPPPVSLTSPDHAAALAEISAVRAVLAQLPEEQRETLRMIGLGMRAREIAAELRISPAAAAARVTRAKRSFRTKFLAHKGDGS